MMLYLYIVYNVIAVLCIVYAIFNPMNVLSWLFVKGKVFFMWLWDKVKGFAK